MKFKSLVALTTSIVMSAGLLVSFASPVSAETAETYDFNTANQLANNFDATLGAGYSSSNYSQTLTGGISNTGAINAPATLNAVFASKLSYSLGSVGSKYTFSAFLKSEFNSGYSGMGFSAAPATAGGRSQYRPNDALGISAHGGGFIFHNGADDYASNWQSPSSGSITAVKSATINDLLNSGSADKWYKVIFIVEVLASSKFNIRVEVWPSSNTGTLLRGTADAIFEARNLANSAISSATTLKSYINFSGYRVSYFDNFNVDLAGNAAVVAAGAPVVLTNASSLNGSQITFNGQVTSENGSTVTERGFVYGTSPSPTVLNTKIPVGNGVGTFSTTTGSLAGGTYYVRSYATNSTGTSYGSEETIPILTAPTLTWNPTNTTVYRSANTLTPSELASTNSSGSITYSVVNAGTSGCTVNSATAVLSFTAAGDCVVRATVAASSPYSSATVDKTFTIQANTAPGAPTSVTATAGDTKATVSWVSPLQTGGSSITGYTVTATPGGATCTATAPAVTCEVTGLTNGTSYTFAVTATNSTGTSTSSTSSSAATPAAPVQAPVVNNPVPSVPVPAPAPATKVSGIQLASGKTPGSSVIKLNLSGVESGTQKTDIQIKLFDVKGKLIKTLTVPVDGAAGSVEVSLPLELGEFTVQASTVNDAGGATTAVTPPALVLAKPFFTPVAPYKEPILVGEKITKPVAFGPNSFKLSQASKGALLALAKNLNGKSGRLAITGFSASAGASTAFEKALAKSRAKTVANFFKSQGLSNTIYFAGYGAIRSTSDGFTPRKVEIRLIK